MKVKSPRKVEVSLACDSRPDLFGTSVNLSATSWPFPRVLLTKRQHEHKTSLRALKAS